MTALVVAGTTGALLAMLPCWVSARPRVAATTSALARWAGWIVAAAEVRDAAEVATLRVLGTSEQARTARARRDAHRARPVAVARRGRARRMAVAR